MCPLRIALKTWGPHGPILLAKELNLLSQADFDIFLSEDEVAKEEQYLCGDIDLLATTLDYVPFLNEKAPTTKFFLKLGESAGADAIVALDRVSKALDLVNTKVALEPPGVSQLLLKEYMERSGFKYSDVSVIETPHDETPNLLGSGEVTAIVTWEPYVQEALTKVKGSHILLTSRELPGIIVEGLVAKQETISAHKQAFVKLGKAYFQAMDYFEKNQNSAKEIMARAFNISQEELNDLLKTVKLSSRDDNETSLIGSAGEAPVTRVYNMLAKLWFDEQLTNQVSSGQVNDEIVKAAIGR